ncbi:MAG: MarR family transcriptional regulator [Amaricoccus sp.]|uniref:MarR family winged helix-turn-helix transcriptional regulator n=1 Tax=Amaricoccus sp. TaxID=1872485 RepID=UPI0039E40B10
MGHRDEDTGQPTAGELVVAAPDRIDLDALADTLSFYIRSLNAAVSRDWDVRIHDLKPIRGVGKVTAMLLVSQHPGIRPSVLAQVAMKDRSEMGRVIDGLEAAGLLARRQSATDSRARALFLTEAGERMAEEVRRRVSESRAFFGDLSEEEYLAVIAPLRSLYWRLVTNPRAAGSEVN